MFHNSVSNWFHEHGYARVFTQGQSLESQLEELGKAKCDRPELQRLLKALEPGSVIVVTRLDRLGRSTIDLLTNLTLDIVFGLTP